MSRIIVREDCAHCAGRGYVRCGDNTGRDYPCSPCGAATALAFLLVRIGSWTDARWDQHVRYEFGDEIADALVRQLRNVPIAEYGTQKASGA